MSHSLLIVLVGILSLNRNGKPSSSRLLNVASLLLGVYSSDYEEQLFRELFQDYNPLIRPVQRLEDAVNVSFSIALLQLINVVEKEQVLKTNVWLQVVCEHRMERKSIVVSFARNGTIIK